MGLGLQGVGACSFGLVRPILRPEVVVVAEAVAATTIPGQQFRMRGLGFRGLGLGFKARPKTWAAVYDSGF